MSERTADAERMRRKIDRAFRREIRRRKRWRDVLRPGWGLCVMGETARKAGISTGELRSIVYGTRRPDGTTTNAIAHALGLTTSLHVEFDVRASRAADPSRLAS